MICSHCKTAISAADARRAKKVYNDKKQLVGMLHNKCALRIEKEKTRTPQKPGLDSYKIHEEYRNQDDDAQAAALAERQREIAEQRVLEEVSRRHDDWRGPTEMDLDDLLP